MPGACRALAGASACSCRETLPSSLLCSRGEQPHGERQHRCIGGWVHGRHRQQTPYRFSAEDVGAGHRASPLQRSAAASAAQAARGRLYTGPMAMRNLVATLVVLVVAWGAPVEDRGSRSAKQSADAETLILAQRAPTPEAPRRRTRDKPAPRSCCKTCKKGKACGDSCISRREICHKPLGCACDAGSN